MSIFSGRACFRGAYYWRESCISNEVGLDNKKTGYPNGPWRLYLGGLRCVLLEGCLYLRGLFFGGFYVQNFMAIYC